ncbi:unnamed protein product, partial [Thlaspi arvense]
TLLTRDKHKYQFDTVTESLKLDSTTQHLIQPAHADQDKHKIVAIICLICLNVNKSSYPRFKGSPTNSLLIYRSLAGCFCFVLAHDPSPLQDFCVADPNAPVMVNGQPCKNPMLVQADDFLFRDPNHGSRVSWAQHFRPCNGAGGLCPGGLNPPHIHPRATELFTLIEGSVLVGFVTSNPENRLISKVLQKGDVFVFPKGLVHFQEWKGNGDFGLSSQNPGIVPAAKTVFGSNPKIAVDVLAKAFQVDKNVIDQLQSNFYFHTSRFYPEPLLGLGEIQAKISVEKLATYSIILVPPSNLLTS